MNITGEQLIPKERKVVWEHLNDPETLQACIMGCESIEETNENQYDIVLFASVGPLKARFKGQLEVSDIDAPNSYRLSFSGTGGAIGFGKGTAFVSLSDQGNDTLLQYESSTQVEGKLAQIGSRLIDAAARKIANDFFEKFQKRLCSDEPVAAKL